LTFILNTPLSTAAVPTRLRSLAASFWLPNFCHPFSIAAEKVLSLGPARCLASFQKDDDAAKLLPAH